MRVLAVIVALAGCVEVDKLPPVGSDGPPAPTPPEPFAFHLTAHVFAGNHLEVLSPPTNTVSIHAFVDFKFPDVSAMPARGVLPVEVGVVGVRTTELAFDTRGCTGMAPGVSSTTAVYEHVVLSDFTPVTLGLVGQIAFDCVFADGTTASIPAQSMMFVSGSGATPLGF